MIEVLSAIPDVRARIAECRRRGQSIGFVPTMGSLHDGHLALVKKARAAHDYVIVSIFVNPLQFGPKDDFDQYPRDLARDQALLESTDADLVFVPGVSDMYPQPLSTYVDCTYLGRVLIGASRPGHFNGVATVVLKLFNIVQPNAAYFGEKDYQQVLVIRQMVSDLSVPVHIVTIPTVRDSDGLALSSRNAYLTSRERHAATILNRALDAVTEEMSRCRTAHDLEKRMCSYIKQEPLAQIEMVAVRDAETLDEIHGPFPPRIFVFLYVRFGNTCLLDHRIVETCAVTGSNQRDPALSTVHI